ncbi:hypothetical protein BBO99_00004656 [Phytophthora kernoviae]|uniref:Plastocyanin-like domain-containing protein n=1 Tax=Phytophthora kernoviae TaxID=325452 RepID=A0A3R7JZP7_9STRA|nr:hypothetical protein JM16_004363 [Phytophthora kernoviae]RLN06327.1 hypothetical protein BBI17_006878 [Phytophthora kernoviae]RLN80241.1 hypothetical protein BBO99_00004656 [Phytophthora kernoviae]
MRLSCLQLFSVAIPLATLSSVLGVYDYQTLRQPALFQSECAKNWGSTTSSSSSTGDPSKLNVNLSVKLARFTSDYVDFNTRTYNGKVPAPTIKVCPGDQLVITLTNELEEGSNNDTNLHLHGMHVPPVGNADNVMPIVAPGGQRQYIYDIRTDHPAGTFWYHPHAHGNVNSQLNGMLAGTLIVVDRPTDSPENLAAMDDLVLLLQAICVEDCHNIFDQIAESLENRFGPSTKKTHGEPSNTWPTDLEIVEDDADVPLNDTSLPTVYVNGQYLPTVNLAVGEYKRLRFVNAIANNVAELVTTASSSCSLYVLAMDGIYFDKPKTKSAVVIPPGGRADVALMCAEIGEFYLEIDCASSRSKLLGMVNQHRVPSQRIVKLKVTSEVDNTNSESEDTTVSMRLPSTLPARPSYMVDAVASGSGSAPDASAIAESNKYDFEFSVWMDTGIQYGVNHEKLNMSHVNHSMPVDELQQWDLSVNDYGMSAKMSCDLDDDTTSVDRRLASNCREWRDTVPLFRAGVQIRFTPREHMVGKIFAHCHIASHVDAGMAQLVSVYKPSTTDSERGEGSEEDDSDSETADEGDEEGKYDDDVDDEDESEEGEEGEEAEER